MNTYCCNPLDDCLQVGHVFWVEHVLSPPRCRLAMTEPHLFGFTIK